jgi:PAS domain S-box-containing protein
MQRQVDRPIRAALPHASGEERTGRGMAGDKRVTADIDRLGVPAAILDAEGRLVAVNDALAACLAAAPTNLTGADLAALAVDPAACRAFLADPPPGPVEMRLRAADGTLRRLALSISPDTRPGRFLVLGFDQTKHSARTTAGDDSLMRSRQMLEDALDWIWEMDARGILTYISPNLASIFGRPISAFLGRRLNEVQGATIAPDMAAEALAAVKARRPLRDYIYTFQTSPGARLLWVHSNCMPIYGADGAYRGYRGISKDITAEVEAKEALRESEQRFRQLYEIAADYYWETDQQFRITHMSPNAETVLGSPVEPAVGSRLSDYPDVEIDPAMGRMALKAQKARLPYRDFVYARRHPSGRKQWISVSGIPVFAADGSFAGTRGVSVDITRRVEAEAASRLAQRHLLDAVAYLREPFVLYDGDDRVAAFNQAFTQLHRAPHVNTPVAEGVTFRSLAEWELEHRLYADLPDEEAIDLATLLARYRTEAEHSYHLRDGRWMIVVYRPLPGGGRIGLWTDITALKQADEAVRRQERQLREILDGSLNGIVVYRGGQPLYVNPAFARLIGAPSPESALEEPIQIHPDDMPMLVARVEARDFGTEANSHYELRLIRRDGSIAWVDTVASRIKWDGASANLASLVDITAQKEAAEQRRRDVEEFQRGLQSQIDERRRAEEIARATSTQLGAVIGASPYAIIGLDRQQNVMIWNHTAETLFGFSALEAMGKPIPIIADGSFAEYQLILDRAGSGELSRDVPLKAARRDGTPVLARVSAVPIYEQRDVLKMVVLNFEDVTRRTQVEEQLRQAQKMEALGQMTGGIAHDFNNLLGVVVGNLGMAVEMAGADPDIVDLCNEALSAAQLGTDLVARLMSFSRKRPLQRRTLAVSAALVNILPMIRRTIGENIEIVTDIDDGLWQINTDGTQLETALLNLAINARDAMAGGGRLTLIARNVAFARTTTVGAQEVAPGSYLQLIVRDTGTGMPPDVVRRCLDPFFSTKGPSKGSGLGLSMVYGFMRQSEGYLLIDSDVGVGTTMEMLFPRDRGAEAAAAANAGGAGRKIVGGSERILIAEDNPAMRRAAIANVVSLGYEVVEAEDAAAALGVLEGGAKIDLLFTDVMMPGEMNGLDLAREVERRFPSVKIVFTSGYASSPESEAEIVNSGYPLLPKPYRKPELASQLRAVLDREQNAAIGTPARAAAGS